MGELFIGTSGYSYSDWKNVFYPPEIKSKDYLHFYSENFNFVELNYTYYRQPNKEQINKMLATTSDNFMFSVKANQSLTHKIEKSWKKDAEIFIEATTPLHQKDRMAATIFQFPYSFHYTKENRLYLSDVTSFFDKIPMVVEFRNNEWFKPSVLKEMEKRQICIASTDNPALNNLPTPHTTITSPIGYIRFHGRNKDSWWTGDNVSRYDYLYTHEELDEWKESIQKIKKHTKRLFVTFNNHHNGKAIANARQLAILL